MGKSRVIAITNQKGGVGKTTTAYNLAVGLTKLGRSVLAIDADAQGNLSICAGEKYPDEQEYTLANLIEKAIDYEKINTKECIFKNDENVDIIYGNYLLSEMDIKLSNAIGRERVFEKIIEEVKEEYDYIIIDCMPSLGILTLNALSCADKVIIPTQAQLLSCKGIEQLLNTIGKVKRGLNDKLVIAGILITMTANTNSTKNAIELIEDTYGSSIRIFNQTIPRSVKAEEASAMGVSVYSICKNNAVGEAYINLAKEVLENEK